MADYISWVMIGFFLFIMYRLFIQESARKSVAKTRGFAFSIPIVLTLAFAIPYFTKNMYQIFFPPRAAAVPIWIWLVIGFAILVIVKLMTSQGQKEVVYLQ